MTDIRQRAIKPLDYIRIQTACGHVTSNERVNQKWSLYFRIRWETGIRPSEGLNLKAQDVYPGMLKVARLKKREEAIDHVVIQPLLETAIHEYIIEENIKPTQRLFPDTIQGAWYIFKKIKDELGLPDTITLHSFRHGFALNFLSQVKQSSDPTTALRYLQRALGHTNLTSTQVYIRAEQTEVDDQMKRMRF